MVLFAPHLKQMFVKLESRISPCATVQPCSWGHGRGSAARNRRLHKVFPRAVKSFLGQLHASAASVAVCESEPWCLPRHNTSIVYWPVIYLIIRYFKSFKIRILHGWLLSIGMPCVVCRIFLRSESEINLKSLVIEWFILKYILRFQLKSNGRFINVYKERKNCSLDTP